MNILRNSALVLLMLASVPVFGLEATVDSWGAALTEEAGGGKKLMTLTPGQTVRLEKRAGDNYRVTADGVRGYVNGRFITPNPQIFSNVWGRVIVAPLITQESGRDFLYYCRKDRMVRYNLTDRLADGSQNIRGVSSIAAMHPSGLMVVEGIVTNGDSEIHTYQFFSYSTGKSALFGAFPDGVVQIDEVVFSDDGSFAVIEMRVNGERILQFYRTDNGERIAYSTKARQAALFSGRIFLIGPDNVWAVSYSDAVRIRDINYRKEFSLSGWKKQPVYGVRNAGGELLVRALGGVYRLQGDAAFEKTPDQAYVFNSSRTVGYSSIGGVDRIWKLDGSMMLDAFSGNSPRIEFLDFKGPNLLGRAKYERIDTLFLYNDAGKEIYRYKTIDEPDAESGNGILAEVMIDRNWCWIAVEDPQNQAFFYITETGED